MTIRRAAALCSVLALLALAGCEEDRMFADCAFDPTLEGACSLSDELSCTNYSCAVDEHPDCVDLTCISFEGAQPRCTRACTPEADDCPEGSVCTVYSFEGSDDRYACIRIEDQAKRLFVSCAGEPGICDTVDADICLPSTGTGDTCSRACTNPCDKGRSCGAYSSEFFCLTSCIDGAALCTAEETCVPYEDTAYCMPRCEAGDEGCVTATDGRAFQLPGDSARCNPHAHIRYGRDDHHKAEALFKALARALDAATILDERRQSVPSTKGTLTK